MVFGLRAQAPFITFGLTKFGQFRLGLKAQIFNPHSSLQWWALGPYPQAQDTSYYSPPIQVAAPPLETLGSLFS